MRLLPALAGRAAGLVVGDDEFAVGVELQPVDDAADGDPVGRLGGDSQLEPYDAHCGRVLHLEVLAQQHLGVGVELRPLLLRELELGELGVRHELVGGAGQVAECDLDGAFGGGPPQQVLECEVDEGALARGRRGRFGEAFEIGEPEREGTAREGPHRAGGQVRRRRQRHLESHASTIPPG